MPQNGYNLGKDVTLTMVAATGPFSFPGLTKFTSKPIVADKKVVLITSVTDHIRSHQGWEGSFELERTDSTADDMWAQIEADYYNGVTELPMSITETIQEVNGSTTQYRYTGVLLTLTDAGDKSGENTVTQKFSFTAKRRFKLA